MSSLVTEKQKQIDLVVLGVTDARCLLAAWRREWLKKTPNGYTCTEFGDHMVAICIVRGVGVTVVYFPSSACDRGLHYEFVFGVD